MNRSERGYSPEVSVVQPHMTAEDFKSIVGNNVSRVTFNLLSVPEGNLSREPDKQNAPQFRIVLNPKQEIAKLESSFLHQIDKVRTALKPRRLSSGTEMERMEKDEEELVKFHASHRDLVTDTLNSFR